MVVDDGKLECISSMYTVALPCNHSSSPPLLSPLLSPLSQANAYSEGVYKSLVDLLPRLEEAKKVVRE